MTWLRIGVRLLLGATALVVVVIAAGLSLVGTDTGTAWTLEWVLARAAPIVTVGRARGSLLGGLVLEDVRVRLPHDELDVARLALDLDPVPALAGTLAFRRAAASSVAYRHIASDAASPAPVPELPFAVRVAAATLDALRIDAQGMTTTFGPTELAATWSGRRLAVERVSTATQGLHLSGNAEVELASGLGVRTTMQWSGAIGGASGAGELELDGTWPTLSMRHTLTAPFVATAVGTVDLDQSPRVDVAIDWRDLRWPGVDGLASPNGRVTVTGTVADYRYEGAGTLAVAGRAATFTARGTGNAGELAVERIELEARTANAGAGRLTATGDVDLAGRSARLSAAAVDVNPAWWHAGWPGRLHGTALVRASLAPLSMDVAAFDVGGVLRGYALTLRGAAEYAAGGRWRLDGVRLASGANRVAVDGTLTSDGLDLTAAAEVATLDLLWPGLRGAVTGNVSVGGTFEEPRARGRWVGHDIAFREFRFERVTVEGAAGGAATAPLALHVDASGVARGPIRFGRIAAEANGTTAAHRVVADFAADRWRAHAVADGGVAARSWRGRLEQLTFDEDLLGPWRLVGPSGVVLGVNEAVLTTTCLEHGSAGRWCGELEVRGRPDDRIAVAAQNFALETLRPLLPPALELAGVYQLSASLFDVTGNPHGALVLTGDETRVRATTGEQQTYSAQIDELRAAATLANGRLELQTALRRGDGGTLDLAAAIRDVRVPDPAIEGRLSCAWPDAGFLALLAPELGQLGGDVTGQLVVAGTLEEPELDGHAAWRGGRVSVPEWGLVIDGIEASAASRGGRALEFDARGRVGDGQLTLTGRTELDPQAAWPTRLTLRGDAVRAVHIPEAEIFVTPDLAATVAWPEVRVTGTVKVPRAALGLSALPAQAVAPSADAVVHGRVGPRRAHRLLVHAGVDLVLGDDVHYRGLDLDTKVTGSLHMEAAPDRSAIATGTLTLGGTYKAYGQELTLERGRLLFSGPLDDPVVDVRAVRSIDTIRVGVELAGTVKSPRTRVTSTPSMSEADALSYLLLGRPVTGNGTQETATLQTAAIAMGLNQALPVIQRLGATLGLDELSVQTTATDEGALMAGKFLSPKLYIRYSYGLFNRIGGLLLRFKFNEHMSIETRSGDQKSMDLLYTVEKD